MCANSSSETSIMCHCETNEKQIDTFTLGTNTKQTYVERKLLTNS